MKQIINTMQRGGCNQLMRKQSNETNGKGNSIEGDTKQI